ncbi:MAG: CvpA family protein [Anaerolineae bacterium]|jgi:uncharacterized membrane protein required for colicin V production
MSITFLDGLLALIAVAICIWAFTQGLLRQLMSLGVFYFATAVAGLFYPYAATYVTAIGGESPTLTETVMFWVLFLLATVAMEFLLRGGFPDTRLPVLGFMDNLLALAPGILSALVIVSLLLSSLGHSTLEEWGDGPSESRTNLARACRDASGRPYLSQFLRLYLLIHPWFRQPPPVLAYLLR